MKMEAECSFETLWSQPTYETEPPPDDHNLSTLFTLKVEAKCSSQTWVFAINQNNFYPDDRRSCSSELWCPATILLHSTPQKDIICERDLSLKMEVASYSDTLISTYRTIGRLNPPDNICMEYKLLLGRF
jgi:hypothetical protein